MSKTIGKKSVQAAKRRTKRSFSFSGVAEGSAATVSPPITSLLVGGWKSISNPTTLNLKGLTVLAGANSSGKSSFFQPTLMLKQTLEAPYDPGALMLDGPHVRFTEASQFLSQDPRTGEFTNLLIGLETKNDCIRSTYAKSAGRPIEVTEETFGIGEEQVSIRSGMSGPELKKQLGSYGKELMLMFGDNKSNAANAELSVTRNRCFLSLQVKLERPPAPPFSLIVESGQNGDVVRAIRSIIHLPGLRGNPERTYPLNATEGLYPGQFQSYTASLIQRWRDLSNQTKLKELNEALSDLGLTSEITTAPIDETRVEIKVGRLLKADCKDFVSIADVGLAVSQVLPVLVALVVAHSGQLVFVEQPELHLHPRAQIQLAIIMAKAVKRGVRILLETHSSLLILGIQTAIARKALSAENVALHWFTRNEQGVTCVTAAEIDSTGSFGDWPEDFADVSFRAETEYLDAVEKTMAGQHAG